MPRYDYKCRGCEGLLEVVHGMKESPQVECPECAERMDRMMGRPNVAPSAAPSRNTEIDFDATKRAEKEKAKDMAAYKRLRREGLQPKEINGSARLEARAHEPEEVSSGTVFRSASARRRSMGLVRDSIGASQ